MMYDIIEVRTLRNNEDYIIMKSLFQIIPEEFFRPLSSKNKKEYADCILILFNSFKPEISYGVNRDIVVNKLEQYFEYNEGEMSFDDDTVVTNAREKANGVIQYLKKCGWIEYEQEKNHQINVVLFEYAVPFIESMNKAIHEEETEYQGIISQIHATFQNEDLYVKPYELIIKGALENTERLISELKKLNVSIKRHMDRQTNDMDAAEILDHFFEYHKNIGSKAYHRMKTSENISYFRTSIIMKIDEIIESNEVMDKAVLGYMEIEQEEDKAVAYDNIIAILRDIKTMFYRLDDIISEIDSKHARYMRNAVMRAKFKLATGNNLEGKISKILDVIVDDINTRGTSLDDDMGELEALFSIYSQRNLTPESFKTIPVSKKNAKIDDMSGVVAMTEGERLLYKEALRQRNMRRFSRKNVNEYVQKLLENREKISVEEMDIDTKRDLIRLVYISIYAGNRANNYDVIRTNRRIRKEGYEFPVFEIIRK